MKKRILKQSVCIILLIAIMSTLFVGCAPKNTEENFAMASATAVKFNVSGDYTTTVTADKVKLSDVGKDDIQVTYVIPDREGMEKVAAGEKAPTQKEQTAEVTSVKYNEDKSLTVSFTDEHVVAYDTPSYSIYIRKKNIGAMVDVDKPSYGLVANVESVPCSTKEIGITLTLEGGEFMPNINISSIKLDKGFRDMRINSVSSKGKNLTIQLVGDINISKDLGIYRDGHIEIDKGAVKNGASNLFIDIPISDEFITFDASQMIFSGESLTIPMKVNMSIVGGIDANSIKLYRAPTSDEINDGNGVNQPVTDGTKLTNVVKVDDNTYNLTITTPGVANINEAAAKFSKLIIRINDMADIEANISDATFYPVFDYLELKNDKFYMTLELYAHSGKFAEALTSENVGFKSNKYLDKSNDFKDAVVESITRSNDYLAELVISVPVKDQTLDDFKRKGLISLSAGTLINVWGEGADETINVRNYSQESIGRDIPVDDVIDILDHFGEGVGKLSKVADIVSIASGALQGVDAIMTILQMTGVVEDPAQKAIIDRINEAEEHIVGILNEHSKMLSDIKKTQYEEKTKHFDTRLKELDTYCNYVQGYIDVAKENLKAEGTLAPTEATKDKAPQYNNDLIDRIKEDLTAEGFLADFENKMAKLIELYTGVVADVTKTDGNNPITAFDKLCAETYCFDTNAYNERKSYRSNITKTLKEALAIIMLYYKDAVPGASPYARAQCNIIRKQFTDAEASVNASKSKIEKPGKEWIYCYSIGYYTKKSSLFSSGGSDANYAFPYYKKNFDKGVVEDFVRRLNGKSIRTVMKDAGFTDTDTGYGVTFYLWSKNDGNWYWSRCRHYTITHSYTIKWDSSSANWDHHVYNEKYSDVDKVRMFS